MQSAYLFTTDTVPNLLLLQASCTRRSRCRCELLYAVRYLFTTDTVPNLQLLQASCTRRWRCRCPRAARGVIRALLLLCARPRLSLSSLPHAPPLVLPQARLRLY